MYTKTATSSEQCFKGTFVFFIEDPKSTFVCVRSISLFAPLLQNSQVKGQ